MRGAPQSGFSKLICPISARNSIDPRAPSPIPRFPPPVAAKSSPMPTDQRLRPDDLNNLQHRRKPAIELDEEQTISVVKPNPSPALPQAECRELALGELSTLAACLVITIFGSPLELFF